MGRVGLPLHQANLIPSAHTFSQPSPHKWNNILFGKAPFKRAKSANYSRRSFADFAGEIFPTPSRKTEVDLSIPIISIRQPETSLLMATHMSRNR